MALQCRIRDGATCNSQGVDTYLGWVRYLCSYLPTLVVGMSDKNLSSLFSSSIHQSFGQKRAEQNPKVTDMEATRWQCSYGLSPPPIQVSTILAHRKLRNRTFITLNMYRSLPTSVICQGDLSFGWVFGFTPSRNKSRVISALTSQGLRLCLS